MSRVAIARGSGRIDIRSFTTGAVQATLNGHEQAITDLVVSTGAFGEAGLRANSVRVVSGSRDGTLRAWDPEGGKEVCVMRHGAPVWTVQEYNGRIYSGGADGRVTSWDASTGKFLRGYSVPRQVCCLRVVGTSMVVGTSNGRLICLDTLSGAKLWEAKVFSERCPVRRVLIDAARQCLFVTSQFGSLREVFFGK